MLSSSLLRRLLVSTIMAGFVATPALSADAEKPIDDGLLFSALFGVRWVSRMPTSIRAMPELDEGIELTIASHGQVSIPLSEALSAQLDAQGESMTGPPRIRLTRRQPMCSAGI